MRYSIITLQDAQEKAGLRISLVRRDVIIGQCGIPNIYHHIYQIVAVFFSAVQGSVVKNTAVHSSAVQCIRVQFSVVQCSGVELSAEQCIKVKGSEVHCNILRSSTVEA